MSAGADVAWRPSGGARSPNGKAVPGQGLSFEALGEGGHAEARCGLCAVRISASGPPVCKARWR